MVSNSLLAVLFFFCQVSTANQENPFGIGALNNLQFFQFNDSASFRCETKASRCGFDYDDYNEGGVVKFGRGSFNELAPGTVWTIESSDDELRTTGCVNGNCVVYCFADCNCTDLTTNDSCTKTTAMPTQAPVPTSAPVPYICPLQEATSECGNLMTNNLPTTDPGCDCYNFCDGQFLSCCNQLSGKCGESTCASGLGVLGCTKADVIVTTDEDKVTDDKNNNNPTDTSDLSSLATISSSFWFGKLATGFCAVAAVALGL